MDSNFKKARDNTSSRGFRGSEREDQEIPLSDAAARTECPMLNWSKIVYANVKGGRGIHVLNPGHPDLDRRDDTRGSVQAGRGTSTCRGMATVGCVPGRQFLPHFGSTENYQVNWQDCASWQSPTEILHAGEEKHIFLPWILLVFGLWNDGVLQSKILVDKQKTETSNYGSDEHPRALEDQWQKMKFGHMQKETTHGIQEVLRNIRRPLFLPTMSS